MLFALASGSLLAADRVRAGGSLALTSVLTLGGLGIAALDPAFWEVTIIDTLLWTYCSPCR